MGSIVSYVYRVIKFPNKVKIVTTNHLSFCHKSTTQPESNILMVDNYVKDPPNVGVCLCPSLMGTFNFRMT